VPVEINKPRYDASKDSEIIEDRHVKHRNSQKKADDELLEGAKVVEKHLPRLSTVLAQVNLLAVLNQILNPKVELAVGEVIGVSDELSSQLANGLLIKVVMECDGQSIQGIIMQPW
jgi:hypothetical protein